MSSIYEPCQGSLDPSCLCNFQKPSFWKITFFKKVENSRSWDLGRPFQSFSRKISKIQKLWFLKIRRFSWRKLSDATPWFWKSRVVRSVSERNCLESVGKNKRTLKMVGTSTHFAPFFDPLFSGNILKGVAVRRLFGLARKNGQKWPPILTNPRQSALFSKRAKIMQGGRGI